MSERRRRVNWGLRPRPILDVTLHDAIAFETSFANAPAKPVLDKATRAVRRLLLESGAPSMEDASTPKEEAIRLLQLAAEIEHALMVQYLYAATSILDANGPGGQNPFIKIMTVAVQEMGHLIAVQNLLLSIGGPGAFHFGRDTIRAVSPGNPIPLALEPISHTALAKFIVAEMPEEIADVQLRARVEALKHEAESSAGTDLQRVGALYIKLFWLFQSDDEPRPPLNLTPAPELGLKPGWHIAKDDFLPAEEVARFEARRDEWVPSSIPNFLLDGVTDATSALRLILAITEQGEGVGATDKSHFVQFLGILDALEANQLRIIPLPLTPVARFAPSPDAVATTPIVLPYAKLWAELFELRYSLLLLDLWHAIGFPNGDANRAALIGLAFANMNFLKQMMVHVVQRRSDPDSSDAAPVFNLMHDDLPNAGAPRWKRHRQMLMRQTEIVSAIRESPELIDPGGEIVDFEGNILLANIEQSDIVREQLISAALGA